MVVPVNSHELAKSAGLTILPPETAALFAECVERLPWKGFGLDWDSLREYASCSISSETPLSQLAEFCAAVLLETESLVLVLGSDEAIAGSVSGVLENLTELTVESPGRVWMLGAHAHDSGGYAPLPAIVVEYDGADRLVLGLASKE